MSKKKVKRDYLPKLRRCTGELEDAIIEKNEEEELEAIRTLEQTIEKIKGSRYIDE